MSAFWDLFDAVLGHPVDGTDEEIDRYRGNLIAALRRQEPYANITDTQVKKICSLLIETERQKSPEVTVFCYDCAKWAFARWRGWHPTTKSNSNEALPDLPSIVSGKCEQCDGENAVRADHIVYENYHGPGSTGLPDYFYLQLSTHQQSSRRIGYMALELPYPLAGAKRVPLASLAKAKKLSDEWALDRKCVEFGRQKRANRQLLERGAAATRDEGRHEHRDKSENLRNQRSTLIKAFSEMNEKKRAKAIMTDWTLPLNAYPLDDIPILNGIEDLNFDERALFSEKLIGLGGSWRVITIALEAHK
jgi:hypothetical protein